MKTINTANKDEIEKFKAQINGWRTSIGLPYCLDDLTPDGGIYTIYCPVRWKGLYSAHELKTALKQDVDAQQINSEYIDFKRLSPKKQPNNEREIIEETDNDNLRQQAAIAAMQGILSNADGFEFLYKENERHTIPIGVARLAIACADELIKQLNE